MLAVKVIINWVDGKNKKTNTPIHIPTGFSIAQMSEFAIAAAQVCANLSTCSITSCSVSVGIDLSGATIRAVALSTSDVAEKALLMARSIVNGLFARFTIPTANEAYVIDGTDQFDPTEANVAALITALEDGIDIGGTIVTPRDKRDNPLEVVSQARETFRG